MLTLVKQKYLTKPKAHIRGPFLFHVEQCKNFLFLHKPNGPYNCIKSENIELYFHTKIKEQHFQ